MKTKKWMIIVIGIADDDADSVCLETIEYVSGTEQQVVDELLPACNRALEASKEEAWQDYLTDFNNPEFDGELEEYTTKEEYLEENDIDFAFEAHYVEYKEQKFRIL